MGNGNVIIDGQGNEIFNIGYSKNYLNLMDITLSNGKSQLGGAIYSESVLNLKNVTFINNSAFNGGAIYTTKTININDCIFINNSASYTSGAIYSEDILRVYNSYFENNNALYYGVIYDTKLVTILNSNFTGNCAKYVGVLGLFGKDNHLENLVFENNSAKCVGTIFVDGDVDISNSQFVGNNASDTLFAYKTTYKFDSQNLTLINNSPNFISETNDLNTTTIKDGYINVPLTDGYYGFCINNHRFAPKIHDALDDSKDNIIINNIDGSDVTEYVKILLYKYLNNTDVRNIQNYIWTFTDEKYLNSKYSIVKQVIADYNNGFRVPDNGAVYPINSTAGVIFDFKVGINFNIANQNLVMYKQTFVNLTHGLNVSKISLNKTVYLGNQTSFTIIVTNTGNSPLNNVVVVENIPEGLIFDSFAGKNWIKKGNNFIYDGLLLGNQSANFTITFNTTKSGNFTNVVVAGDNSTNGTANNTTTVYAPSLEVVKIVNDSVIYLGNQTSFTVVVRNTGDCSLDGVWVVENIPEGLVYAGFTGDNWVKNGNKFIFTGFLAVGKSANFTIFFNTTKSGNFTNIVVAGANHTSNKTANNTTVVYAPNLSVIKLVNTPNVYLGNQTIFTIIVKNTGDCSLDGVWVAENIPDGLVYAGFAGDNWVKVGDKFVYNFTLAAGQSVNFTIVFNTTKSGNFTNIVVAGANHTSNKTANNTTVVYAPSLEVVKIVNDSVIYLGNQTSFTVVVRNTGDCSLENVYVIENVPDGLVYAGFTGDNWVKNGNKFIFTGSLAAGKSANFTIFFNTTKSGNFTNIVVAGANHTSNKTANNTTVVYAPNLSVVKIVNTPNVYLGNQTIFTIIVKNTGDCDLNGVWVVENVPDGLVYAGFTGDN